jgi:hypothetical protein
VPVLLGWAGACVAVCELPVLDVLPELPVAAEARPAAPMPMPTAAAPEANHTSARLRRGFFLGFI